MATSEAAAKLRRAGERVIQVGQKLIDLADGSVDNPRIKDEKIVGLAVRTKRWMGAVYNLK